MDLLVYAGGIALWGSERLRCALGRTGVSAEKREGDGATPQGSFALRRLLYRADRLPRPSTHLPCAVIAPGDGWCDDPGDPLYNQFVRLPYTGRAERLWRDDHLYDLVAPLGYNDAPVIPGAGSAIFLHLAQADYGSTEGCVALAVADLLRVLAGADPRSHVIIHAALSPD